MARIPQPCVVDANVLLDLYLSELLRDLFRLSLELVAAGPRYQGTASVRW